MCTVSFLPANNGYYITSNRDEKNIRLPALPPQTYMVNGKKLLFPRDGDAGGSWIGINESGHAAVLLNGGFIKHVETPPYRKSRGLIFVEILSADSPLDSFLTADLIRIRPFTLILLSQTNLYECCWDGSRKHTRVLSQEQPHIWSSVTLYEPAVIAKRKYWFAEWLKQYPAPSMEDILLFHRFAGDGDPVNDIRMNRDNRMLTVSITSIEIHPQAGKMTYFDLLANRNDQSLLPFTLQSVSS